MFLANRIAKTIIFKQVSRTLLLHSIGWADRSSHPQTHSIGWVSVWVSG